MVDGQPMVFPVNYVYVDGSVVVRTGLGTLLAGAALNLVAFEVDGFDAARRSGWSVLVQGMGFDVTDALDTKSEALQRLEMSPWAPGPERAHGGQVSAAGLPPGRSAPAPLLRCQVFSRGVSHLAGSACCARDSALAGRRALRKACS